MIAKRRILITSVTLLLLGLVSLMGSLGWLYNYYTSPNNTITEQTVIIEKGASTRDIIYHLADRQIISYPFAFRLTLKFIQDKKHFVAGEYLIPANASPQAVYNKLTSGEVVIRKVTIPEGLTTTQIIEIIHNTEGLEGKISEEINEGDLLPETYHFTYGETRNELVQHIKERMAELQKELWENRQDNLPFDTWHEALTLASIVEKETGVNDERARVAAVFINRLKKGMRLQSDPTVIYAITEGKNQLDRPLSKADLKIDSPYNTYVKYGLPPHPIAHAGRASIEAVLQPMDTKELYFVADGNGGHNFAKTLKEHNRNVQKYRKLQRANQ